MQRTLVMMTILFEMVENLNISIDQYLVGMAIQDTATATDNWNDKTVEYYSINLTMSNSKVKELVNELVIKGLVESKNTSEGIRLRVTSDWRKEYINARTY